MSIINRSAKPKDSKFEETRIANKRYLIISKAEFNPLNLLGLNGAYKTASPLSYKRTHRDGSIEVNILKGLGSTEQTFVVRGRNALRGLEEMIEVQHSGCNRSLLDFTDMKINISSVVYYNPKSLQGGLYVPVGFCVIEF